MQHEYWHLDFEHVKVISSHCTFPGKGAPTPKKFIIERNGWTCEPLGVCCMRVGTFNFKRVKLVLGRSVHFSEKKQAYLDTAQRRAKRIKFSPWRCMLYEYGYVLS